MSTRRRSRRVASVLSAAVMTVSACGSDGAKADFIDAVVDSDVGDTLGEQVATRYAECLWSASDGDVSGFAEHLDDPDYRPDERAAAVLGTCSDVLNNR